MKKLWVGVLLAAIFVMTACGKGAESDMNAEVNTEESEAKEIDSEKEAISDTKAEQTENENKGNETVSDERVQTFSVIGGADGPTSIFLAGKYDLTDLDNALTCYLIKALEEPESSGIKTESHVIMAQEENGDEITVYLWSLYEEFEITIGSILNEEPIISAHIPCAVTLKKNADKEYELVEVWMPRDGSNFVKDIQIKDIDDKFPKEIRADAKNSQLYIETQSEECLEQAKEYVDTFKQLISSTMPSEEVTLSVLQTDMEKATLLLKNTTQKEVGYGDYFTLEYLNTDNIYEEVPLAEDIGFCAVLNTLASGEEREITIDFNLLFHGLKTGQYRVTYTIYDTVENGVGKDDRKKVMAEFHILE